MQIRLIFLLALLGNGCVTARFSQDKNGSVNTSPYGDQIIYTISCEAEKGQTGDIIRLPYEAGKYLYGISPMCQNEEVIIKNKISSLPVNMIFVLDRSGSMAQSISRLKSGIIDLADMMEANHLDVKYAAIGFRDYANDFLITPFTSAASLEKNISGWQADGGQDPQEAGFLALEAAADILEAYLRSRPDRENAINIIVYSSDALAYSDPEHSDFSVQDIARTAREWNKKFNALRIYYSIPSGINPDAWGLKSIAPDVQFDQFMRESLISGKKISFPLDLNIFQELTQDLTQSKTIHQLECFADSATLETAPDVRVSSWDSKENLLEELINNNLLLFRTSPDPLAKDYTLRISRCCRPLQAPSDSQDCGTITQADLRFRFQDSTKN